MSNRLCVIFWGANSEQSVMVARGNFKSIVAVLQACAKNLPIDLTLPQCDGHVFVGHENDYWIKNLIRFDGVHAELWKGTVKSGPFEDFLKGHIERHCPEMQMEEEAVPA